MTVAERSLVVGGVVYRRETFAVAAEVVVCGD